MHKAIEPAILYFGPGFYGLGPAPHPSVLATIPECGYHGPDIERARRASP